jgi:glycine cleavage system H protein
MMTNCESQMGDDSVATVGITDYAQEQLGDIVHISLPAVGDDIEKK